MEPSDNIGVSTCNLIKEAIEEGRNELAKDLIDYYFIPEHKLVHDKIYEQLWGWPSFIRKNYGEDAVYDAYYNYVFLKGWARDWFLKGQTIEKLEARVEGQAFRASWVHRMGKHDGIQGYTVEEYEDRFERVWDPCSSGGRMRRGDPITGMPSKMGEPYNLGVTRVPHPWSLNKTGVSLYRVHCCVVHGQKEVDRWGYLNSNIEPTDPPDEICRRIYYKDQDNVPEEYYNKIGKTKPKPMLPVSQPEDPTKLIKVMHDGNILLKGYYLIDPMPHQLLGKSL